MEQQWGIIHPNFSSVKVLEAMYQMFGKYD
jgi:hypothetical protein